MAFPRQPNCVRARMCDSSNSRLNQTTAKKIMCNFYAHHCHFGHVYIFLPSFPRLSLSLSLAVCVRVRSYIQILNTW